MVEINEQELEKNAGNVIQKYFFLKKKTHTDI